MREGPTIDGRTRTELLEALRQRAADYTDEWDPYTEDSGTTLMALFARFGTDVLKRLDGVPHKHRVAFLNALDFDRRPPQSARVPLTFTTTPDIETNVVVPGGTQVTAETEDGDTEIFEIPQDDGFEATPATLQTVHSVDPGTNTIYDHSELLDAGDEQRLFAGTDRQKHEFYLGHEDLLNLDSGSTLTVKVRTPSRETLEERVSWEYFGENSDGELGWHRLPRETEATIEELSGDDADIQEKMKRLKEEIVDYWGGEESDEALYEPQFRLPGPTELSTVAGVESRWIRARIPGDDPSDFEIDVESLRLNVEGGGTDEMESIRPEMAFSNDVPLSIDVGDFYPLGKMPQPPTTLYLASEEAFTKHGGVVAIQFSPPENEDGSETDDSDGPGDEDDDRRITATRGGPLLGPPEISWEYWNGNGWTRLVLETDETSAFTSPGTVKFTVPDDLDSTSVSGHEGYWIRARLVSGNYGQPQYEVTSEGTRGELIQRPDPPVFGDISVGYGQRNVPFEKVRSFNNVAYRTVPTLERETSTPDRGELVAPFASLPDETQTLYLGFGASLTDGPVNLYLPMADQTYPSGFEPGIRWEYCANSESWTWKKLNVYDGTEGLTEPGVVSINFPTATTAFELFGQQHHWIRARVTRDEFVSSAAGSSPDHADQLEVERFDPGRPAGRNSKAPPTLGGIYPNTQLAYNELTVEEVLGTSDGSPDQAFSCDRAPITEADVWVDEAATLSQTEQRDLEQTRPDDVRRESSAGTESGAFWVRWVEVADFLDSDESSRDYRLDRTNGTITFGDGRAGAIPPTGEKNIEVTYQTGGGSEGNVPAGSITDVRSSISLIDSVTNLQPGDGGTDIESLDGAVSRAPKRIKNRGRAVSAEDFEQIAKDTSRELATVRCEPEMDETGRRTPGWVTLLVIPRERRDRPTPSLELRQRVEDAVSEQAPATLVGPDQQRIVVRGPDYAEVSVETTVDTRGVESVTNLKNTVEETLVAFFHPLTGGSDGDGWDFGTAPRLSQLTTLVEATPGVDRVRDIAMTIETTSEEKIIRDPEKTPVLSRDEMVSSGTHDVNVIMRGQR